MVKRKHADVLLGWEQCKAPDCGKKDKQLCLADARCFSKDCSAVGHKSCWLRALKKYGTPPDGLLAAGTTAYDVFYCHDCVASWPVKGVQGSEAASAGSAKTCPCCSADSPDPRGHGEVCRFCDTWRNFRDDDPGGLSKICEGCEKAVALAEDAEDEEEPASKKAKKGEDLEGQQDKKADEDQKDKAADDDDEDKKDDVDEAEPKKNLGAELDSAAPRRRPTTRWRSARPQRGSHV